MRQVLFLSAYIIMLSGCTKPEGPGGNSAINGFVESIEYSNARVEITDVIFPDVDFVNNGDYWVLNGPSENSNYYIWFSLNGSLVSKPNVSGRTSIKVNYTVADDNVELAEATYQALVDGASADFELELNADILTITCIKEGEVADAANFKSEVELDVKQQGRDVERGDVLPASDEYVYLKYGDNASYSERTKTLDDGFYQFTDLRKGDYTVWSYTVDTLDFDQNFTVEKAVSISDKNSVVEAELISIVK